jgi:very-short-patch-repair endonuclease
MNNRAVVTALTKQFARRVGKPKLMPTERQMRASGESSLAAAILKNFSGFPKFAKKIGLKARRNPYGRFSLLPNLCDEVRRIAARRKKPREMPTTGYLRQKRLFQVMSAIDTHGGVRLVAQAAGLKMSHNKKDDGFYDDFSNVESAIVQFITNTKSWGIMPSHGELCLAGQSGLSAAISKHDGFTRVALRLGLPPRRKPKGHWTDERVEAEVLHVVETFGTTGVFPTDRILRENGFNGLAVALARPPGRARKIAKRLGLFMLGGKPGGWWHQGTNLERAILAFIDEYGEPGAMPTQELFIRHGRHDLVNAINRVADGISAFAKSLKLSTAQKPRGYYRKFGNVRRELIDFNALYGTPGCMPSHLRLSEFGPGTLPSAIYYFGGYPQVAERLGWKSPHLDLWPQSEIEIVLAHELRSCFHFDIDHHAVAVPDRDRDYECDIVIKHLKVIVEYDSARYHSGWDRKGRPKSENDRRKADALRSAGWAVIRVRQSPLELTHHHDVVVTNGIKRIADATVRRVLEVTGAQSAKAQAYLAREEPRAVRQAQNYIKGIRSRRGSDLPPSAAPKVKLDFRLPTDQPCAVAEA